MASCMNKKPALVPRSIYALISVLSKLLSILRNQFAKTCFLLLSIKYIYLCLYLKSFVWQQQKRILINIYSEF